MPSEAQSVNSAQYVNQPDMSIIKMRLDTDSLISEIKDFLRGKKTLIREVDGRIITEQIKYGEEQCNDEGYQQVMGLITSLINSHTAQGNFKEKRYDNLIHRVHSRLAFILVTNYKRWGIKAENRVALLNHIITLAEIFLSRTIDNEERKSYSDTIRTVESSRIETPSSRFSLSN